MKNFRIITLLSVIFTVGVVGCDETSPKDGFHGIDRAKTWGSNDFAQICLDGVAYYLRAPNHGRGYMAVIIDGKTLKPRRCDN
jgi:hypothetical protein